MCHQYEFIDKPIRLEQLIQSPQFPEEISNEFAENKCLQNSNLAARSNDDLMVEGILLTLFNGKVVSWVEHCWNKNKNAEYYDVTKDYVWTSAKFREKLERETNEEVSYIYFKCVEYPKEEAIISDGVPAFHYSYKELKNYFSEHFK